VLVIVAANRDLRAAVDAGIFRIRVPPLRDRRKDILALVEYFIDRYPRNAGRKIRNLERRTLELLLAYDSQVDIRELQNVVVRAVILSDGETSQSTKRGVSSKSREQPGGQSLIRLCSCTRNAKMIEAALGRAGAGFPVGWSGREARKAPNYT
jgi:transcriptional regulator with GAF, ATPase, and Fis domain